MKKGFTLIETIIAVGIGLALLAFVLANYSRGGIDSILSRETSLLISRLRYAQELTSTGSVLRYQEDWSGAACFCDPAKQFCEAKFCTPRQGIPFESWQTCPCCPDPSNLACDQGKETPQGGFAVGFSCLNNTGADTADSHFITADPQDNPQIVYARSKYYLVAERLKCVGNIDYRNCFPLNSLPLGDPWDSSESDGIISMLREDYKGDTTKEKYVVDSIVQIINLRLTYTKPISLPAIAALPAEEKISFTCADKSPWYRLNVAVPDVSGEKVTSQYPIQATVRFVPPDGRVVDLNDNIYEFAPTATGADPTNPVKSVEVMLKLKKRNTDCRVVTITKAGAISQAVDNDCAF